MDTFKSTIDFQCSDEQLNRGFAWAKRQALAYAHHGEDPVGLWYEAALPGRDAFCMRDVAHHSLGAAALGLGGHTRNMLLRFAEGISESRDWCTYWEITKDNLPAPVDYTSDEDFWYNLPANFDLIDACYRQYLWTGDRFYLDDPAIRRFYRLTVTEYVRTWDKDGDGIPEYEPAYGRRGLASYYEGGRHPRIGGDLIAAMIAGYRAYARIAALTGENDEAVTYDRKAELLRQRYESEWWDPGAEAFYGEQRSDKTFGPAEANVTQFLALYYDAVGDSVKRSAALRQCLALSAGNVEEKSYLPDTYYRCGLDGEALRELRELTAPELERREYPEVSFCAVGAYAGGLMGIAADGSSTVSTMPHLAGGLSWAETSGVPILGRRIAVRHDGVTRTTFKNESRDAVWWRAQLAAVEPSEWLLHNGIAISADRFANAAGHTIAATVQVLPGETHIVELPAQR